MSEAISDAVLERDGWRCQHCGGSNGLQIHHICSRIVAPKNILAKGCHGVYLVMLPAGNASKPLTKGQTQWLLRLSTLHGQHRYGQHGSVPAAVAVVSRGPIFMEWLSINFCDLCTHARIDVEIATSDSMALRDMPHDSSVNTSRACSQVYSRTISE